MAETVDQAYQTSLKHYYDGRYKEAVEGLSRLLAIPMDSEDLHYNLGCAFFRLGRLGPAIYHFEKTLAREPSAEDARFNLDTSRALVASRVKDELKGAAQEGWWPRLLNVFSAGTWAVIFLVLWWLTFGILLALRYINPGPVRAGLIAGNSFIAALTLICGLMILGKLHRDHRVTQGIVLPAQMAVHEGPAASTKTTFKLHAGFKVRLQSRADGWVRIRLPNGLEGWVPHHQIGVL